MKIPKNLEWAGLSRKIFFKAYSHLARTQPPDERESLVTMAAFLAQNATTTNRQHASWIIQNTFDEASESNGWVYKGWRIRWTQPESPVGHAGDRSYDEILFANVRTSRYHQVRQCASCGAELLFSQSVLEHIAKTRPDQRYYCKRKCQATPRAKLTRKIASQVKEMILASVTDADIVRFLKSRHEITFALASVSDIRLGKAWKEVDPKLPIRQASGRTGETNSNAVLTSEKAIQIVKWDDEGKSQAWIIRTLGVGAGTVYAVRHGITWSHVTGRKKVV